MSRLHKLALFQVAKILETTETRISEIAKQNNGSDEVELIEAQNDISIALDWVKGMIAND